MIGQLDNDQLVLALAAGAFSDGNGNISFTSGNFPTYPNGAFQDCILTNMTSGFGYINTGFLSFDGSDDQITTNYDFGITNSGDFTIEVKLAYDGVANNQVILTQRDDDSNYMMAAIRNTGKIQLLFRKSGTIDQIISTDTLSTGDVTLHFRKDGTVCTLWVNGIEVAAYDTQDGYALGDLNITNKMIIGVRGIEFPISSNIYWLGIYEKALSNTTISAHASLSNSMGLYGYDDGNNVMTLRSSARDSSISATYDGEPVIINTVGGNGSDIYFVYVDSSSNLRVQKKKWKTDVLEDGSNIIGTSATIN